MNARKRASPRTMLIGVIMGKVRSLDLHQLWALADHLQIDLPEQPNFAKGSEQRTETGSSVVDKNGVLRGSDIGPIVSLEEGHRLLDAISVDDDSADWMDSDFLGTTDLAKTFSISLGKLRHWRKTKKVMAFRMDGGYVYPLRQFVDGLPVKGLDEVAKFFSSAEQAWEWLNAYNTYTGERAPIEALRNGEIEVVTKAAESAHWSAYG